eukprot:gene14445-4254_t
MTAPCESDEFLLIKLRELSAALKRNEGDEVNHWHWRDTWRRIKYGTNVNMLIQTTTNTMLASECGCVLKEHIPGIKRIYQDGLLFGDLREIQSQLAEIRNIPGMKQIHHCSNEDCDIVVDRNGELCEMHDMGLGFGDAQTLSFDGGREDSIVLSDDRIVHHERNWTKAFEMPLDIWSEVMSYLEWKDICYGTAKVPGFFFLNRNMLVWYALYCNLFGTPVMNIYEIESWRNEFNDIMEKAKRCDTLTDFSTVTSTINDEEYRIADCNPLALRRKADFSDYRAYRALVDLTYLFMYRVHTTMGPAMLIIDVTFNAEMLKPLTSRMNSIVQKVSFMDGPSTPAGGQPA